MMLTYLSSHVNPIVIQRRKDSVSLDGKIMFGAVLQLYSLIFVLRDGMIR